ANIGALRVRENPAPGGHRDGTRGIPETGLRWTRTAGRWYVSARDRRALRPSAPRRPMNDPTLLAPSLARGAHGAILALDPEEARHAQALRLAPGAQLS
ncbi:MAG: hypothetical protein ACRELC_01325, partial [Gemmatimonadota bacterium]